MGEGEAELGAAETERKKCPLRWVGGEQQLGKFMCKLEAGAPGVLWCLALLSFGLLWK